MRRLQRQSGLLLMLTNDDCPVLYVNKESQLSLTTLREAEANVALIECLMALH